MINQTLPPFAATTISGALVEQFQSPAWSSAWVASKARKDGSDTETYSGAWSVEAPAVFPGLAGDLGLVMKTPSSHHAISRVLDEPFDASKKDLVLQYEVKFQNTHECGGAYIKLLTHDGLFTSEEFQNASPYSIMFGPDKCGQDNKLHFIFRHTNPTTGVTEEKHLVPQPQAVFAKISTLYTLVIRPDSTFEIFVNQKSVKAGSLLKDFTPSVQGQKEIPDISDTKPADWVDADTIEDESAQKPLDWDEEARREIPDLEATQPEGWLSNEPTLVADPSASPPVDWDQEEDGEWTAPLIKNPLCSVGCGEWKRPSIPNPAYKGTWNAPKIANPAYKGEWHAKMVANPAYISAPSLIISPIGAVGFELWTIQSDILFDNIYLGHSLLDAQRLAKESFEPKNGSEAVYEQEAKKEDEKKFEDAEKKDAKLANEEKTVLEQAMAYVEKFQAECEAFIESAKVDIHEAVKTFPHVVGSVFGIALLLLLPFFMLNASAPAATASSKKEKTEKKTEKIEEVIEEVSAAEESDAKADSSTESPKKRGRKGKKE